MTPLFPIGARVLIDGRTEARVHSAWPEGSTSYGFPHYRLDVKGGDKNIAVALARVGVMKVKPAALRRAQAAWKKGPRVRVDTLKKGDRFVAIDGCSYTYERPDGALSGVHHATGADGEKTSFAGSAEVIPIGKAPWGAP